MQASAAGNPRLEVCVEDEAGLKAAVDGGADRIELCSALSVGGLTPSVGFMRLAAASPVPVHALIRPRAGGFVYREAEIEIAKADIAEAKAVGLAGVVIGILTEDGRLDMAALGELASAACGMNVTLSRAFDLVVEPERALDQAISLGFSRILTSGCAVSAQQGIAMLRSLADRAKGRIGILPGGGVRAENAGDLLAIDAIVELHASCRSSRPSPEREVAFGFADCETAFTDQQKVSALKAAMQRRRLPAGDIAGD